jgi:hypothetical protein
MDDYPIQQTGAKGRGLVIAGIVLGSQRVVVRH